MRENENIKEDYKTRDFSVNSLIYDIKNRKLIDFIEYRQCKEDLKNKVFGILNPFNTVFYKNEIRFYRYLTLIGKGLTPKQELR